MSHQQRDTIRELFAELDIRTAERFAPMHELTGVRLTSVTELCAVQADLLVERLRGSVASVQRVSAGDPWADRDEIPGSIASEDAGLQPALPRVGLPSVSRGSYWGP